MEDNLINDTVVDTQEIIEQPEETSEETSEETTHEEQQESPPSRSEKKSPSESWRELRDKNARLERERDEALRLAYQYQLQQASMQQPQPQRQSEPELDDDEIVDVKTLKAYQRKQQAWMEEQQRLRDEIIAENKILMEFPDFREVVTPHSIEKLNMSDPDVAYTLSQMPDFYRKARSTYAHIKKMQANEPSHEEYVSEQKAAKNATKPRPVNAINAKKGASPLEHASQFEVELTPERKQQLYQQMLKYASGR